MEIARDPYSMVYFGLIYAKKSHAWAPLKFYRAFEVLLRPTLNAYKSTFSLTASVDTS
jgi:hypothetical protein